MALPEKSDLLSFIASMREPLSKRDLTQVFKIKGDERRPFKAMLSQLEKDGLIVRQPGQRYSVPEGLPAVTIIEVIDIDLDGDVFARPVDWNEELQGPHPRIEVLPGKKGHPAPTLGARVLARIRKTNSQVGYEAVPIKSLDEATGRVMGLVVQQKKGFVLRPTDRKSKHDFEIPQADLNGASDGDLALGEVQPSRGMKLKKVRIREVIGREDDPRAISLIALHEAGLNEDFPHDVLKEAQGLDVPSLKGREDLRDIPLVTIDGADARDYDDAVFAEPDKDPKNPGGWHLIVAIADVSYYVREGSALDREAWKRGNSTYFPDRVVPMLPENLSNGLCSLMPRVERACLAMHMWINKDGKLIGQKCVRGLMKSAERLVYEQVQAAKDGQIDDATDPLMQHVIEPLYKVYEILDKARQERGALDLDLPERQILIDEKGNMTGVKTRSRVDAHKLIEEFMILANVAAARALEGKKAACVYRVHDRPASDKLDSARQFLDSFGLNLPSSISKPKQVNHLLTQAKSHPYSHLISMMVLRTQSQAVYAPSNIGHFGLALEKYAHFTSPIRRYADLVVHRSLIDAYNLGPGGLTKGEEARLEETCEHISTTERNSSNAERSAVDRFTAAYLEDKIGAEFNGVINGVTRFGLFVTLDDIGADGLVPIRTLPNDYFIHDEEQHALIGRKTRIIFRLGAQVRVKIVEAERVSGSTVFEIINAKEGADIPGFKPKKGLKKQDKSVMKNRSGKNTKRGGKPQGRKKGAFKGKRSKK